MPLESATEEELDSLYNVHLKGVGLADSEASSSHQRWWPDRKHLHGKNAYRLGRWLGHASMKVALEFLSRHMAKSLVLAESRRMLSRQKPPKLNLVAASFAATLR